MFRVFLTYQVLQGVDVFTIKLLMLILKIKKIVSFKSVAREVYVLKWLNILY